MLAICIETMFYAGYDPNGFALNQGDMFTLVIFLREQHCECFHLLHNFKVSTDFFPKSYFPSSV